MNTVDNASYYRRTPTGKEALVRSFVESRDDIDFIFDVGCNNGLMSYQLQRDLGKRVYGVDLSTKLSPPADYHFDNVDIVKSNDVVLNDCTLFLSLYHHVLGWHGLEVADDLFYRLLLRTKYLVFDSGNLTESRRRKYMWHPAQKKHFSNEADLLSHFGVPYEVLGMWSVGGGVRTVVVFERDGFDGAVELVQRYKRKNGTRYIPEGLFDHDAVIPKECDWISFFKLRLGDRLFFAKKHHDDRLNHTELSNIVHVYKYVDPGRLLKFYGYSEKYGLIYEWVDKMVYKGHVKPVIGGKKFTDIDVFDVGGREVWIDFER